MLCLLGLGNLLAGTAAYHDGLQYTHFFDGSGKLIEFVFVENRTWLMRIGANFLQAEFSKIAALNRLQFLWSLLFVGLILSHMLVLRCFT